MVKSKEDFFSEKEIDILRLAIYRKIGHIQEVYY